jgi:hypothetical protein
MKTTLKLFIIGLIILFNSCTSSLFTKKRPVELYLFTENDKWGYMDKNGKVKIKPIYDGCCFEKFDMCQCTQSFFSNKLCIIMTNNKYGVIDYRGKEIIKPQYDDLAFVDGELFLIAKKTNKWGIIDLKNTSVFPFIFDDYPSYNKQNAIGSGEINGVFYLLNFKTKEMILTKYDKIKWANGNIAIVSKDKKFGYINKKGDLIIGLKYDDAYYFHNGLAAVQVDKKWGFIDTTGKMIINLQFDEAFGFIEYENSLIAFVEENGKSGVIDNKGHYIIHPIYQSVFTLKNGLFLAENDGWGIINKNSTWLLPNEYNFIFGYSKNGYVSAQDSNYNVGIIDLKTKNIIVPFEYKYIQEYKENGLTLFGKKDSITGKTYYGYFDKKLKVKWRETTDRKWVDPKPDKIL